MKNCFSLFILAIFSNILCGQDNITVTESFDWGEKQINIEGYPELTKKLMTFRNARYLDQCDGLPTYSKVVPLSRNGTLAVNINTIEWEPFDADLDLSVCLKSKLDISTSIHRERRNYLGGINFVPVIKENGQLKRIKSISYSYQLQSKTSGPPKNLGPTFATQSVLSSGTIYKLAISKTGLYQLDYNYLSNDLGINMASLDPRQIQIFSHPEGKLPQMISDQTADDLIEIPIIIDGEDDGRFDTNDRIIIYAPGPHTTVDIEQNVYDYNNYLFLKIDGGSGKRIGASPNLTNATHSTDQYDFVAHHELDNINLLGSFISTPGSGQEWYGEVFTNNRQQDLSNLFDFQDINTDEALNLNMSFAGRSGAVSEIILSVDNQIFKKTIGTVSTGDIERRYARIVSFSESIALTNDRPEIMIDYPSTSETSEAWLDYLQFAGKKKAIYRNAPITLRDATSLDHDISEYNISGSDLNSISIWDVTDFDNITRQEYSLSPIGAKFGYQSDTLRSFVVFDPSSIGGQPEYIGNVSNQNLHGITAAEMLVIYHPDFEDAAIRMADHRSDFSDLDIITVNVVDIYNEFSSGKQDPTAIRNFCKMIYDRDQRFNYILIIGDGSYDYRGITPGQDAESFVPTYETIESIDPIRAFPSDDYYALLSDFEGGNLRGALDVAVGRLPARTLAEANTMVDKIIHYDTNKNTLGDWRVRTVFLADDEDSNIHVNDADGIATESNTKYPQFNQEKIYFDAFVQESTPGGARYPAANQKFNKEIFKGALVANYLGHGGPKGWSQERVLKIEDINSWQNPDKLPLIITATCSFTGFDDPPVLSAGEQSILRADGGAVGLFSTVRSVYANQNERLTRAVFDTIFTKVDGDYMRIGEILRRAKNSNQADTININARKFAVFGDPSMKLAIPKYNVITSEINGQNVGVIDTIKALQTVNIKGYIADDAGEKLSSFNGTIYPTVFDKVRIQKTLKNDSGSRIKSFEQQNNIIFKGAATVTAGMFSFDFVVPLDIDYSFGNARVSYYAQNENLEDAMGYFDQFVLGGIDSLARNDQAGPLVELYMNNDAFVSGGMTNTTPTVFARLSDDIGINVSGTSIGHDITGLLDDNTQNTFVLNEFYTAEKDDFTKGVVRFPLDELEVGRHNFKIKAFDVANNPGEAYLEFVVIDDSKSSIKNLLNYPNPFSTNTNFSFEHGLVNASIDVQIDIYTISGKLVKSIQNSVFSDGFRVDNINWNGKDDFGNSLGRGIYLYKVKLFSADLNISSESTFQKLVLLN